MESLDKYVIANIAQADTPFLAVYPDMVSQNIQKLIGLFASKDQIRPHVKTHKCPHVVHLLLDAGIAKFKCATITEAEMLALSGAKDILMAYQPVGPKIERFINLSVTYPDCKFSCLVDNEASAQQIANTALKLSATASVWIDLNVGMNRTGVVPGEGGKELYLFCNALPSLQVVGLHAYDGHITDPDPASRIAQAKAGYTEVETLARQLYQLGFNSLRIAAGSTPTISFYAQQPQVECSPGTFIYWDQHYQNLYPEFGFQTAMLVITRVISRPQHHTVCLDLGYKAISSESAANERLYIPQFPQATVVSQSEEHMLVNASSVELQIGAEIYGVPYHIGRTCNLYEACAVINNHHITGKWLHTARSR
jgi:D-serine deaminase-like pyridoxal phosphate-dependent protein